MKTSNLMSATALGLAVTLAPLSALAQAPATAITDLNLRSGPGPEYPIVGLVRNNEAVQIVGCIEGSLWCQVAQHGREAWAYSQYLVRSAGAARVIVSERRDESIPTVIYRPTTVVPPLRYTGALVVRPVEPPGPQVRVVAEPPPEVGTYVVQNPLDPVYLNGEVVVGAGLPETVRLRSVPNYQYEYVDINGQQVLVDPATRRVVYVYR